MSARSRLCDDGNQPGTGVVVGQLVPQVQHAPALLRHSGSPRPLLCSCRAPLRLGELSSNPEMNRGDADFICACPRFLVHRAAGSRRATPDDPRARAHSQDRRCMGIWICPRESASTSRVQTHSRVKNRNVHSFTANPSKRFCIVTHGR